MYETWATMKARCHNKNHKRYPLYGGRGISVCDRWLDFENFVSDMGQKPSEKHSLDRIDNDKGYCPENCRWASQTEQVRNRRNSIRLTARGETKTLTEWLDVSPVSYNTLLARLRLGWAHEDAIFSNLYTKKPKA
jgi:hypothetical protein